MAQKRSTHGLERRGFAQTQRGQTLAERAELDDAFVIMRRFHAAEKSIGMLASLTSCVTRARISSDLPIISMSYDGKGGA